MPRDVAIRVSMQDGETVRRALQSLGADGEAALKRLERGGLPASAGLRAVDAAVKEVTGSVEHLAARAGAGTSVLRAFGPGGLAAAAGVGALVIGLGALMSKAREAAEEFDHLQDSADRLGTGTEFLQGVRFAVGQSGGDIEKTEAALDKLNAVMGNVANGNAKEAAEAFKRMGVSVTDSEGRIKSLERFLPELADGYEGLASAQDRASVATQLFGRGNQAFARVLADGADGLRRQIDLAREMGAVVDEELVRKGAEAKDKLEALAMVVQAQLNGAVIDAVPAIVALSEGFAALAKYIGYTADAWKSLPDQRIATLTDTLGKLRAELEKLQSQRDDAIYNPGVIDNLLNRAPDTSDFDRTIAARKAAIAAIEAELEARAQKGLEFNRGTALGAGTTEELDEFSAAVQDTIDKLEEQAEKARLAGRELAVYEALLGHENATEKERLAIRAEAIKTYEAEEEKTRRLKAAREEEAEAKKKQAEAEREHQKLMREGERVTEQVGTAEEQRAQRLREINELLLANAISEETAARARQEVEDDLLDDRTDVGGGFERGLREIRKDVGDTAEETESLLTNAFSGAEDALVNFVKTGKLNFGDLVDSMIDDVARLAIQLAISGIFNLISGGAAPAGVAPGTNGLGFLHFGGPRAGGGPVSPGSWYMVGERGPEPFVPSVPGNILPNSALGGGYSGPMQLNLNVRNESNGEPQVTRAEQRGNQFDIDMYIERKVLETMAGSESQRLFDNGYGMLPARTRR